MFEFVPRLPAVTACEAVDFVVLLIHSRACDPCLHSRGQTGHPPIFPWPRNVRRLTTNCAGGSEISLPIRRCPHYTVYLRSRPKSPSTLTTRSRGRAIVGEVKVRRDRISAG
ncbi:hypothetical protein BD311DRAFT_704527, partial [Dichomitus squalens]